MSTLIARWDLAPGKADALCGKARCGGFLGDFRTVEELEQGKFRLADGFTRTPEGAFVSIAQTRRGQIAQRRGHQPHTRRKVRQPAGKVANLEGGPAYRMDNAPGVLLESLPLKVRCPRCGWLNRVQRPLDMRENAVLQSD